MAAPTSSTPASSVFEKGKLFLTSPGKKQPAADDVKPSAGTSFQPLHGVRTTELTLLRRDGALLERDSYKSGLLFILSYEMVSPVAVGAGRRSWLCSPHCSVCTTDPLAPDKYSGLPRQQYNFLSLVLFIPKHGRCGVTDGRVAKHGSERDANITHTQCHAGYTCHAEARP